MDQDKQDIEIRKHRFKCSKMVKVVIQKGKEQCRHLLAAYESPELKAKHIVDELKRRQERRRQACK